MRCCAEQRHSHRAPVYHIIASCPPVLIPLPFGILTTRSTIIYFRNGGTNPGVSVNNGIVGLPKPNVFIVLISSIIHLNIWPKKNRLRNAMRIGCCCCGHKTTKGCMIIMNCKRPLFEVVATRCLC